jgi:hypothetical protein
MNMMAQAFQLRDGSSENDSESPVATLTDAHVGNINMVSRISVTTASQLHGTTHRNRKRPFSAIFLMLSIIKPGMTHDTILLSPGFLKVSGFRCPRESKSAEIGMYWISG